MNMKKFALIAVLLSCAGLLFTLDIKIDNKYADWKNVFSLASFSQSYSPVYFNQEKDGKMTTLEIAKSQYWGWGGTLLKDFRALYKDNSLYFNISSQGRMTKGLIIYLYLYRDRDKGNDNPFTLELSVPADTAEKEVRLWTYGESKTKPAGIFISNGTLLEGRVDLDAFPPEVAKDLTDRFSFDLTTCFFDGASKLYEEFFFTTVYFKDIPNEGVL
jgi:hypothetical protein